MPGGTPIGDVNASDVSPAGAVALVRTVGCAIVD